VPHERGNDRAGDHRHGGEMSERDLVAEFGTAASALLGAPGEAARLLGLGVQAYAIDPDILGVATISLSADGRLYWPDPESDDQCFIVAVRGDPAGPESVDPIDTIRTGELVDLLAIHPDYPDRWASRLDCATWLGSIAPQRFDPEPVPIHRSPLAWLRGGCRGLCLLGSDIEARQLLLGLHAIEVASEVDARVLQRQLETPPALPRILVAEKAIG
jgi:hypothetical protein